MLEKLIIRLDINKSNYNDWKVQVTGLLKSKHLYKIVSGQSPRPQPLPSGQTPSGGETASDVQNDVQGDASDQDQLTEDIKQWDLKDEEAQGIIIQTISVADNNSIQAATTSYEIWNLLKNRHISALSSKIPILRKELESVSKPEHRQLRSFVEEFNLKMKNYEEVGGHMSELEKCRTFLQALQREDARWGQFCSSKTTREYVVDYSGQERMNPIRLLHIIQDAEEAYNIQTQLQVKKKQAETNNTEGGTKVFKPSSFNLKYTCNNCGGIGHTFKICSSFKRDNAIYKLKQMASITTIDETKQSKHEENFTWSTENTHF
jgi:hypothetical protein